MHPSLAPALCFNPSRLNVAVKSTYCMFLPACSPRPPPPQSCSTSRSLSTPLQHNSDKPGGFSQMQTTEGESRGTTQDASALSVMPCCSLLPFSTLPPPPPTSSTSPSLRRTRKKLETRTCACREDGGEEQRDERRRVNVTSCVLLPAQVDFATRRLAPLPVPCLFPRPQSTTATILQALCGYGGQKRRADARETTDQRCPWCSALHSSTVPPPRASRSHPHPSSRFLRKQRRA